MITLTPEQQKAHDLIVDWYNYRPRSMTKQCRTLGGYAGTGKTTLVASIASTLKEYGARIAFCAVSGKASSVLRVKLADILKKDEDYCGTIHSLIYRLIRKEKLKSGRTDLHFAANEDAQMPYTLLIVDEASMINEWIFKDLLKYGIPILAVGDHGQLPPVKGSFNLMASPDIKLETIMRQAEGNPIIKMAMMARLEGRIPYGDYGGGCMKTRDVRFLHDHYYADINSIMLCALNKTRVRMNSFAREILKRNDPSLENNYPIVGEPVICLYNNHRKMIYNGNIGLIKYIEPAPTGNETDLLFNAEIDMGDFIFKNSIDGKQFGKEYTHVDEKDDDIDFFDWAYCITTHKAQGSEWKSVLVMEEGDYLFKGDLWSRWLYTAATRAKERLIIYKR